MLQGGQLPLGSVVVILLVAGRVSVLVGFAQKADNIRSKFFQL